MACSREDDATHGWKELKIVEDHLRSIQPSIGTIFAGSVMSQSFSAIYWFERFFQEIGAEGVIEFGTGNGTLTQYFGLHCPGRVTTYDTGAACINDKLRAEIFTRLSITYKQVDLLADGAIKKILEEYAGPRPLLVFCDNGNKKQEFLEAAPRLEPGDSILVHDVNVEFHPGDPEIAACMGDNSLIPWKHNAAALADGTRLSGWLR